MLTRINGNLVSNPWILTQVAKALLLADILCCRRIFQIFVCSTSWTLLPSTCYGQHLLSNPSTVLHSTAIPRSGNCHVDFSSVQNATNYLTPTSYGIVLRIIFKTYLSKLGKWLGRKKGFALSNRRISVHHSKILWQTNSLNFENPSSPKISCI